MTAISKTDLFAELEDVLKAGSLERRNEILRRMTGLSLPYADRLLADMHFVPTAAGPNAADRWPASHSGAG